MDNLISRAEGDGIFIHTGGSGLPEVSGVFVRRNEISDTGRHGILATGSEIIIEGNKISRTKASGIYIHGSVTVIENQIEDSKPGILADGGERIVIKRNRFRNAPLRILDKNGTEIGENVIE
jgi:parallel beta-helix repeat protein